jgi:predicted metal-dependent hydrolase
MTQLSKDTPTRFHTKDLCEDIIRFEGMLIPFRYYCSPRRRSLAMSVYPDRSIVVRAPFRTSQRTIRQFVLDRGPWILKVWKKREVREAEPPCTYLSGNFVHYAGKAHVLEVISGNSQSVACISDRIIVTNKGESEVSRTKKLLFQWYRSRADILFHDRMAFCHDLLHSLNMPLPELRIRKMRSRWGSYSSKGTVNLNLLLIMTPVECLDYVIIHELCHHRVAHHGPEFWKLLACFVPDYKDLRKKLNHYAFLLSTI